jgi:transcriptional regulator NrdR family protein
MNCPKCSGRALVVDSVLAEEENYRKRRCLDCNHVFYTVEYEAVRNEEFREQWKRNYRKHEKQEGGNLCQP